MIVCLTQNQFAIISHEHQDLLETKWQARWAPTSKSYCAIRTVRNAENKRVTQYMHRVIWERLHGVLEGKMQINHVDRDSLNNLDDNIERVTNQQNAFWRGRSRLSNSGYKGVSWHKSTGKWQAQIEINYKNKYLGVFVKPELAALAYDEAAKKYHGEYAVLNFPEANL